MRKTMLNLFNGDVLGIYNSSLMSKDIKIELSKRMNYNKANEFKNFLLRNQNCFTSKKLKQAIEDVIGIENFLEILNLYMYILRGDKESENADKTRIHVFKQENSYSHGIVYIKDFCNKSSKWDIDDNV